MQWFQREEGTTSTRLIIIKSTRNIHMLLDYVQTAMDVQINKKCPHIPSPLYVHTITYLPNCNNWIPVHIFISHRIVWFNIQWHFWSSLSVRASDSGQPVSCARKCCTERNFLNIHTYTQAQFKINCTLQYMTIFLHQSELIQNKFHQIGSLYITGKIKVK